MFFINESPEFFVLSHTHTERLQHHLCKLYTRFSETSLNKMNSSPKPFYMTNFSIPILNKLQYTAIFNCNWSQILLSSCFVNLQLEHEQIIENKFIRTRFLSCLSAFTNKSKYLISKYSRSKCKIFFSCHCLYVGQSWTMKSFFNNASTCLFNIQKISSVDF